jgi:xylulose-5-phosphate/fructose-6-phosphate phosphoketolase
VGHLAAAQRGADEFLLIVGTGHASSFVFAHETLVAGSPPEVIGAAIHRYGQPGGDATEAVGAPGVPYLGGELGPALAVGQSIAAAAPPRLVVTIVGDGECETPVALAAFAHREVVLGGTRGRWLPVVNANRARMGSASRFAPAELATLLSALGYRVFRSGTDAPHAAEAATAALAAVEAGERAVWISETEKGWPAPASIGDCSFRGHRAHKAGPLKRAMAAAGEPASWLSRLTTEGVFENDGRPAADVVALAQRASLGLPSHIRPRVDERPAQSEGLLPGDAWRPPITGVDAVLARAGVVIFSPDEAASNRLVASIEAGHVREVLAEAICCAWTWGSVEAGRPAAFATYEAFAPLAASQLAQYAKMVHSRPVAGRPPLLTIVSSLGWANSPTHQNTDIAGTFLARPWPRMHLVCPLGASSAAGRVATLVNDASDSVAAVVCSKHPLLDVPDPGTAVVRIRLGGADEPSAALVALGDVCVTESIAAMAAAAAIGVALEVFAVVQVSGGVLNAARIEYTGPVAAASCFAPAFAAPALWRFAGRMCPVAGYEERWGATPCETLIANRLDRGSLLETLGAEGCELPGGFAAGLRAAAERAAASVRGAVSPFDCPPLEVAPHPPLFRSSLEPAPTPRTDLGTRESPPRTREHTP